jgi:uncharacterized membrane protein YbhN (UPF0104 family)
MMANIINLNRKNILFPILTTLLTFGILAYLFLSGKEAILEFHWRFNFWPLIGSFFVFSINLILMSLVWRSIMSYLGYNQPIKYHFKVYWISNFLKRIPGTIWYVVGRAKLYESNSIPKRLTTIASGIEFAMLILSSFSVGLVFTMDVFVHQKKLFWIAIIVFIIALILVNPKTIKWLFLRAKIDAPSPDYKMLIEWFLVYLIVWIGNGVILFLTLNTISIVDKNNLFFVIGSVAFVNLMSSSLFFAPSNLGVSEVTLSLLLSSILPSSVSVIVAILSRALLTFFDFIWALIGYFLINDIEHK